MLELALQAALAESTSMVDAMALLWHYNLTGMTQLMLYPLLRCGCLRSHPCNLPPPDMAGSEVEPALAASVWELGSQPPPRGIAPCR